MLNHVVTVSIFFRHFRSGYRNRKVKTHHARTTDQFFEDGRHQESLGDHQPTGKARGPA